ncbi:flagellar motor protein MotB [Thalassobaculum fulvum]|uniref:Flagellar motor protein MotB n=1 Tax=Thalassobaculum fulvum TaxID=1633335 RepID=A0A918XWU4_9PROT|nr:OmpA family protein [Thalassobaculum fulvum]GHD60986.1 flagellar motor protein MotB [Thalassobaculum fulvum]
MPLTDIRRTVAAPERMLGRRAGRKYGGGPSWLVTLVDLVSLMLAFFVMRFAMTTLESPGFDATAASIALALGKTVSVAQQEATPPEPLGVETERRGAGFRLSYLEPLLEAKLARDPVLRAARIERAGDRLVIALPSDLLFVSGRADLTPGARAAVAELATALANLPNRIEVLGHADPRPMAGTGQYGSNRALSLARADSVAVGLVDSGLPRMPIAAGLGDSRFYAVAPTAPLEQRYTLARRVDVVVLPERAP